jgi:uncharacterized protein YbcC (UPF0753/DUF2309 family)
LAAEAACGRIPPLWPLQHFVAVNPFVGLAHRRFPEVCALFQRLVPGGIQMTPAYYREKFQSGAIMESDLEAALSRAERVLTPEEWSSLVSCTVADLKAHVFEQPGAQDDPACLTVAEAADRLHGTHWTTAVSEAIGQFCAAYFDSGQSRWPAPWKDLPLFEAWLQHGAMDASLELLGLPGLRKWISQLPKDPEKTLARCVPGFRVGESLEDFLHKQLLSIRGWAGYVQYRVREKGAQGEKDSSLLELLAIRVALDSALLERYDSPDLREFWAWDAPLNEEGAFLGFVWQLADEHAWERTLRAGLASAPASDFSDLPLRPSVQAVFCIDVRSEVLRRALEHIRPGIATIGFAGFFGMPIARVPFGRNDPVPQCPVLLQPKYKVHETPSGSDPEAEERALRRKRLGKRIAHSLDTFKGAAVSSFSFVETAGLTFAARLIRDAFGLGNTTPESTSQPVLHPDEDAGTGIPFEDRVTLALGALRNMGLTRNFARLVLLCGHGSNTTNNPYGAALDCGACGGHAGDTNARVGAALLNEPEVRAALAGLGVVIPQDTWFLAGLHDTTTDHVRLFDVNRVPKSHQADLDQLRTVLDLAGARSRCERAPRLGIDPADPFLEEKIQARSRDWAQVRPEWGLAGNAAFIAAPRARTRGVNLGGRVFLHDYDHRADPDNRILEMILCAPLVVASWINLQYFASTVNNPLFGSGNKAVHNVVGTLGIFLGNGGDLQPGLPLQSVHDGNRWIHEPVRLHAVVEAPRLRIDAVLSKNEGVRHLAEHGWVLLFAREDESLYRYEPGGEWTRCD